MSKILKGFVAIDALQSLVPGVVSPAGEISIWSLTYTKDKTEFSNSTLPGYRLTNTSYFDTSNNKRIEPTTAIVQQLLTVVKSIYVYATTNNLPYDTSDFILSIAAQQSSAITNLSFGPLIPVKNIQVPEWIEYSSLTVPDLAVKVWLSDEAFASQYDLYEIVVIPPIPRIDDFFGTYATVSGKVSAVTISQMMDKIQIAKDRNPETYIRTELFDYVSGVVGKEDISTNWTVLIYGAQGDNIDAIKDALVEYIMSHTTHTRAQWEAIFPDIFKRTEFVILPRWDKFAIEDMAVQSGLYSSILNPYEVITFAVDQINFYEDAWVRTDGVIYTIPFNYKGISLEIVRGPNNSDFAIDFQTIFTDYISVGTSSLDFNRMTTKTQDWVLLVERMLIIAESFDSYTTIPDPFRVITRNEQRYLSLYYENVNYLMALKGSYSNYQPEA